MELKKAISNLESISKVLENASLKYDGQDPFWPNHLEQMSYSLYTYANELKNLEDLFDLTLLDSSRNNFENTSEKH